MPRTLILTALALATLMALAACGGGSDEQRVFDTAGPAGAPGETVTEQRAGFGIAATAAPAATAVPALSQPPAEPAPGLVVQTEREGSDAGFGPATDTDPAAGVLESAIAAAATERIIVRTVDLDMDVDNVNDAITRISRLATNLGGWVVSTQHIQVHTARIAVRVPAASLDNALSDVKAIASEVTSEITTSQDFTEEFTDASARIDTLQRTLDSLRALFDRADAVEDAIAVQQEITRIQSDLEALQARVNFLSQSSAFSLINVNLSATPVAITPDAGEDVTAAVRELTRFRVKFSPGEGYDDNFEILWDFGDGSNKVRVTNVAPTSVDGEYISAPVTHAYADDRDSPYIVTAEVTSTGRAGVAEGDDTVVVTVSRIPVIDVFAGETSMTVESGARVEFRGSFTRPEGLTGLTYEWDFGDGTTQQPVSLTTGATTAEATHVYENFRLTPYTAVLTVKGQSPAGPAEATGQVFVTVTRPDDTLSPSNVSSNTLDALQTLGAVLLTVAITLGIFSPVWIIPVAAAIYLYIRHNRRRNRPTSPPPAASS